MINVYDIGDLVRLAVTFQDATCTDQDPSSILVRVKAPDGTVTVLNSPTVVKDAVGQYHADFSVTEAGYYYYRWEGTGTLQAAGEVAFRVRESRILT